MEENSPMKPIRLSHHASGYFAVRGFTAAEVESAIRSAAWQPASQGMGRWECRKNFPYGQNWNGKQYAVKQVRPVFVEKETEILVVTVYTYYF